MKKIFWYIVNLIIAAALLFFIFVHESVLGIYISLGAFLAITPFQLRAYKDERHE